MKIIVCGAGIAGLTVAGRLQRLGHDVIVVEQSPAIREAGFMIDFFGIGFDVAERLGLLSELETIHSPVQHLTLVDAGGRTRARLPYVAVRWRWFANRHFNFLRGDLERVLSQHVRPHTIRFATSIRSIAQSDRDVALGLSDGTSVTADLVIGADGIHSSVRTLVFGPEEAFVRPLGYEAAAFVMSDSWLRPAFEDVVTITVPNRQVAIYPIPGGAATFFLRRTAGTTAPTGGPSAQLKESYGDLDWIVPALLRECEHAHSVYVDRVAQVIMPTWYRGRVVLVGDACGCVSLLAGQGASLAMFGAVTLADAITAAATLPEGLERYQQRIAPMVAHRQRAGRALARWFVPDTHLRLTLRDLVLRASLSPLIAPFIRHQLAA
jgi:2-polyprenyl-6-methoxyphenol hydroxylase-like FAD-dependent oxidoreductase